MQEKLLMCELSRRGHPVRRAPVPVAGRGGMLPLANAILRQCKTCKSVIRAVHIFIQPTSQDNRLKIGKTPVCEIAHKGTLHLSIESKNLNKKDNASHLQKVRDILFFVIYSECG